MTTHDPLCPPFNGHLPRERCEICRLIAKVRADERARLLGHLDIRRESLADLRAKVEALPENGPTVHPYSQGYRMAVRDVLDLIDGADS